jgi:hypothetical protein
MRIAAPTREQSCRRVGLRSGAAGRGGYFDDDRRFFADEAPPTAVFVAFEAVFFDVAAPVAGFAALRDVPNTRSQPSENLFVDPVFTV